MVMIFSKGASPATATIVSAIARASKAKPSKTALNIAPRVVVDRIPMNAPHAWPSG
jgi:hypothetical protein